MKTACVNPDAGKQAMQWVLDLFDKCKVSTRDVTNRYKAFGTGQGSHLLDRPVDAERLRPAEAQFPHLPLPEDRRGAGAPISRWAALELYVQKDTSRYEATMQAVKWLSDNGFLWTTKGRGASPRLSILARPDYKTAGHPWSVRGAFVDGMSFATRAKSPSWPVRTSPSMRATISWPRRWSRLGRAIDHRRGDVGDPGEVAVRSGCRLIGR